MAFGQVTQVVSRNAVGYVKVPAQKGKFHMLRYDFLAVDGTDVTISELLGDQVPSGSSVFKFDKQNQIYVGENKLPFGWVPGTNTFEPGEGFWLKVADAAVSNVYNVFLMGEVPDRFTQPTGVVDVVSAFNMLGYPFPVAVEWTNTQIAKNGSSGDSAFFFDPDAGYTAENRLPFGWVPGSTILEPGDGFWYKTSVGQTWEEPKPYTWP
jgi:hypothetical protein